MMENVPAHDSASETGSTTDVLVCPDCSHSLPAGGHRCDNCNAEYRTREGIPSFCDDCDDSDPRLSEETLTELATRATTHPVRTAAKDVLARDGDQTDALASMFDVRRNLWHVLVDEHLSGRCLDLYGGYGRRAMALAELTDSVYAVDPSVTRLRILDNRDDYASSDRVTPIHTTDRRLPFADGAFDTIVADLTDKRDLQPRLNRLTDHLAADGSLLFTASGWPSNSPLARLLGSDRIVPERSGDLLPGTAAGYRSLAQSLGFEDISVYTLFPSAARPLYAFDVDSDRALRTILGSNAPTDGWVADAMDTAAGLVSTLNLAKHCYPTYLVACSNGSHASDFGFSDPLVVQGRTRTVVLDMDDSGISTVWKIPNRAAHRPYTRDENAVISELKSSDPTIAATLPAGEAIESKFGPVRKEEAVDGIPLEEEMDGSAESFERVLRLSFDWLVDFQRAFRSDSTVRSPERVRDDLTFEPADLVPPLVDERAETFTTPVHGDYMPGNIHHNDGTVTSVIDWEYGSMAASPVVDAGFLLLNVASWVINDFSERVETVLCRENEYSEIVRSCVHDYCDAVGLPYRTFELYLPSAYLHRIRRDWNRDAVTTYTDLLDRIIQRTQILFDARDDMIVASAPRR